MSNTLIHRQTIDAYLPWPGTEAAPKGTLVPAEQGAFAPQSIDVSGQYVLEKARQDLLRLLFAFASQHGWSQRIWKSMRRLTEIDDGHHLRQWLPYPVESSDGRSSLDDETKHYVPNKCDVELESLDGVDLEYDRLALPDDMTVEVGVLEEDESHS